MQILQDLDGTGVVTIPKGYLDDDGLLTEDGDIPDGQCVDVGRLDRRTYVVRFPEEHGDLPELAETSAIRRIAAQVQFVPKSRISDRERAD